MVTLCAASGYAVHFFPTGQGNVIGNAIVPVIKICSNPRTVRLMSEHIDVDTSGLLQREINLDQAGDQLLDCMPKTAASCCNSSSGSCATELRAVACNCIVVSAPAMAPTAIQPPTLSLKPI